MSSISTTNADLLAAEFIIRSEFDRLDTHDRKSDAWASVHARARLETLKDLKRVRDMDESDLDDATELNDAVLYKVIQIAYRTSDVEGDDIKSKKWQRRYEKELGEVELSSGDATLDAHPITTVVYRS